VCPLPIRRWRSAQRPHCGVLAVDKPTAEPTTRADAGIESGAVHRTLENSAFPAAARQTAYALVRGAWCCYGAVHCRRNSSGAGDCDVTRAASAAVDVRSSPRERQDNLVAQSLTVELQYPAGGKDGRRSRCKLVD